MGMKDYTTEELKSELKRRAAEEKQRRQVSDSKDETLDIFFTPEKHEAQLNIDSSDATLHLEWFRSRTRRIIK